MWEVQTVPITKPEKKLRIYQNRSKASKQHCQGNQIALEWSIVPVYMHQLNQFDILPKQGLAFRGNDESDKARNQGNFLELL